MSFGFTDLQRYSAADSIPKSIQHFTYEELIMYYGTHITGKGNPEKLRLIDKSYAAMHSSPTLPNMRMLYQSTTDMFGEGFLWGDGWWIQNSYGFTMGAVPLLNPFWSGILQNSYDAFWKRIGDGKRMGADSGSPTKLSLSFVAPDGALGDTALKEGIVYKQGDGDIESYDWFYEATAAGVVMEAEMLLFDRREEQIRKYMPLIWRSLNHLESARAENGLFLVGASANLLAPSYGGSYDTETDTVGKGYLTGVSVTYSAALKRCIELLKMMGDTDGAAECQARLDRNLTALPQLLTEEGYFVKSMEPNGTKHGVYGAARYGYLEGVCNVDAIAWEIVSRDVAETIYNKIASVPGIRQAGILCNNYPHLDDTPCSYRDHNFGPDSFYFGSGDWVDGGCWATVEGRAILAYMKLGKYEDAFRAADVYMRWAEEYRQDAPLSQWGHNTNNPWQQENADYSIVKQPVAVMVDNFAPITCLLRGLFDTRATAEGLYIRPQVPDDITEITLHEPFYFGGCQLYVTWKGGTGTVSANLNGCPLHGEADGWIFIPGDRLPVGEKRCLSINCSADAEPVEVSAVCWEEDIFGNPQGIPEDIAEIYRKCGERLQSAEDPHYVTQLREIMLAVQTAAKRRTLPYDKHKLRPMTEEKIKKIVDLYDTTVRKLYAGLQYRNNN